MPAPHRRRIARIFAIAFGLSLLVHIIFAALLFRYQEHERNKRHEVVEQVQLTTLIRLHPTPTPTPVPTPTPEPTPTPVITPTPTPIVTPTPPPVTPPPETPKPSTPQPVKPKPAPAAPAHLHLNVPHTTTNNAHSASEAHADNAPGTQNGTLGGHGTTGGPGAGTGADATAAPATPEPAACAHPNSVPAVIDQAEAEQPEDAQGQTGLVQVQVDLDANSKIISTEIYKSSGVPAFDREALKAANLSTYRTERKNCVSVPGSYTLRVNFDSQ